MTCIYFTKILLLYIVQQQCQYSILYCECHLDIPLLWNLQRLCVYSFSYSAKCCADWSINATL